MHTSQPNIVNLRTVCIKKWVQNPNNLYIGRKTRDLSASKWGNPYPITDTTNRTEVIDLFKNYLQKNEGLKSSLHELQGKVLGCWCAPQQCHAEVLHHRAGNIPQYSSTAVVRGGRTKMGRQNGKIPQEQQVKRKSERIKKSTYKAEALKKNEIRSEEEEDQMPVVLRNQKLIC